MEIDKQKKKKYRKTGIYVTLSMLILFIMANLFPYILLWHQAKDNLHPPKIHISDSINIIGLLDSYGVPYSSEISETFLDIIHKNLQAQNKSGKVLDLFNLYMNKTWDINGIINNDVTIGEFTAIQNYSIEYVRHKYGERVRNDLIYSCPKNLSDLTIGNYIATQQNPVIIYSCSANNLFYYFGTSLESLNFSKITELVRNWNSGLAMLDAELQSNMTTLLTCNPNAQIFVMGLYVPSSNFILQRSGSVLINQINRRIRSQCQTNDHLHYVDVSEVSFAVLSGDFHPNQEGHQIIANKLAAALSTSLPAQWSTSNHHNTEEDTTSDFPKMNTDSYVPTEACDFNLAWEAVIDSDLPKDDYVKCSVIIEKALLESGLQNANYQDLRYHKEEFLNKIATSPNYEEFVSGYEILLIERKILDGIDESNYKLHPENARNDKLSLLSFIEL